MKPLLIILLLLNFYSNAQKQPNLPIYNKGTNTVQGDWLIDKTEAKARLYQTEDGKLVFSNGIVARTFSVTPNCATVGLDLLSNNESFLRSVRPEAEVEIDGMKFNVGGLTGQPIHNYLLPEWLAKMETDPSSLKLVDYAMGEIKARFPWKKRVEWMPKDMPWPHPGKELVFRYKPDDAAIRLVVEKSVAERKKPVAITPEFQYLKDIVVEVHYEMYDGMPLISKWIKVVNQSTREIRINTFKSEILAVTESESMVDSKKKWMYPNITVETDYNFGGMSDESLLESSVAWNTDTLYKTQVNYERTTPCLLETYPKYGPDQSLQSNKSFESFRIWELLHDSRDPERKGLEHRRILRALAPWSTENPILMHVSSSKDEAVKKAVDQCAEVGFEMVIMTFGSGFNAENETPENFERMKNLANYAHSKGIALGGYSLLASRRVGGGNDVVMPEGMTPRFGNSPCLESKWGIKYFEELYNFYEKTGLDILEHDGSYPGDICDAKDHPGHTGLSDSQWNQYRKITEFYQWCRAKGIYLNVPDYYFLAGSNKTGMGYRETNWSLPREQQEIIERQNIYDGTWNKTPSMGWMFVPLVQYHGGGAAATIEPLKEHLTHYGQRLANLFGAGVQACYRGPQLYDAPETKALVEKWVSFYKKHRRILDGDIIHIRRADGRDFDAILHVDPSGVEKGLLMMYNPLNTPITRTLNIPVYYTGLKDKVAVKEQEGTSKTVTITRDYKTKLTVTIPAKGYQYYVLQ
jgi:hypothetical protein